jgi:DNA-binding SARP family transcriptional activator
VRVRLLGGFSVSVGFRILEEGEWRLRKAANLVKILALSPGHRMHRERMMDMLWPDLGSQAASNNLRGVIHAARRILEPYPSATSRYLTLQDDQVALCPEDQLWVDVEAFEEAAAAARRSQDPAAYRTAIELYAGELLPKTATRSGRRNTEGGCGKCTSRFFSGSHVIARSTRTMTLPSRR